MKIRNNLPSIPRIFLLNFLLLLVLLPHHFPDAAAAAAASAAAAEGDQEREGDPVVGDDHFAGLLEGWGLGAGHDLPFGERRVMP
jgi:hypothetical protein